MVGDVGFCVYNKPQHEGDTQGEQVASAVCDVVFEAWVLLYGFMGVVAKEGVWI
jgi:hypothetical protein